MEKAFTREEREGLVKFPVSCGLRAQTLGGALIDHKFRSLLPDPFLSH
jgi:hypothetical protein